MIWKDAEVVDMSWMLSRDTLPFPGGLPFNIRRDGDTRRGDVVEITSIDHLCLHYGTHVDCPSHMLCNMPRAEELDVSTFVGRGRVIDCRAYGEGEEIGTECLGNADINDIDFLLFLIGWHDKFNTNAQYGHYPILSKVFAEYLGDLPNLKGIAVETNNVDHIGDTEYPIHRAFMRHGNKIIYEAVTNMESLLERDFLFIGVPINVEGAEAGIARPVALVWR